MNGLKDARKIWASVLHIRHFTNLLYRFCINWFHKSHFPTRSELTTVFLLISTDPYVKLSLYCDGVRLSKANTRVKRKTLNPVFNEKFNFNVNSDQISLTTVVLKVVNHYDVNFGTGGSGGMGQVVLGYNSQGSGQEQWNSMLESPSRHIEKWHKIYRDNSMWFL